MAGLKTPLLCLGLIAAITGLALPQISAGAAPSPAPAVGFTASVAPGQNHLQAAPGGSAQLTLYATSSLSTPLPMIVAQSQVQLGDNGNAELLNRPDSRFANLITISPQSFIVPPHQTVPVNVTISVPNPFPADTYVIGFGVVPQVPGSGNFKVVSEIGLLVELTVPGTLHTKPVLDFRGLNSFSFGTSDFKSAVVVRESGSQSSFVTGEVTIAGGPGGVSQSDFRFPQTLVAATHYRLFNFTWHSSWGIGIYTVKGTVTYNITPQTTGQISITRTVVVVNPLWIVALLVLLIAAVLLLRRWIRSRRSHSSAT